MKKTAIFLAFLATATVNSASFAKEEQPRWPNWYVGLHGGVNWYPDADVTVGNTNNKLETADGYALGASFGYAPPTDIPFFDHVRWEAEYTYRHNGNDTLASVPVDGEVQTSTYMLNMIYDFMNDTRFTPYMGLGAGLSMLEFNHPNGLGDADDSGFAWQFLAGVELAPEIIPMTAWGLRYRYVQLEDVDFTNGGNASQIEYDSHSVEATARFRF